MRGVAAALLGAADAVLPLRRMRMTAAVAAATAGYVALIALQLSLVVPYRDASAASLQLGTLLSVGDSGGCGQTVCLLGSSCAAGLGGSCLLPVTASPAPPAPAPPAPRTPVVAPAAPAAPPAHPAPVRPAPVARVAPHVTVVPAAPPPAAPPATVVVSPVVRSVPAAAAHDTPPLTGGSQSAPVAVPAPRLAAAAPTSVWWLYAIFAAVDLAAAVALAVLIRRTSASQSRS